MNEIIASVLIFSMIIIYIIYKYLKLVRKYNERLKAENKIFEEKRKRLLACRPHLWEKYGYKPTELEKKNAKPWRINQNGEVEYYDNKKQSHKYPSEKFREDYRECWRGNREDEREENCNTIQSNSTVQITRNGKTIEEVLGKD
jgi:hypothetical protein